MQEGQWGDEGGKVREGRGKGVVADLAGFISHFKDSASLYFSTFIMKNFKNTQK